MSLESNTGSYPAFPLKWLRKNPGKKFQPSNLSQPGFENIGYQVAYLTIYSFLIAVGNSLRIHFFPYCIDEIHCIQHCDGFHICFYIVYWFSLNSGLHIHDKSALTFVISLDSSVVLWQWDLPYQQQWQLLRVIWIFQQRVDLLSSLTLECKTGNL